MGEVLESTYGRWKLCKQSNPEEDPRVLQVLDRSQLPQLVGRPSEPKADHSRPGTATRDHPHRATQIELADRHR